MRLRKTDLSCYLYRLIVLLALGSVHAAHGFTPIQGPVLADFMGSTGNLLWLDNRYYRTNNHSADWSGTVTVYRTASAGDPGELLWSSDQTFTPSLAHGQWQTWRLNEDAVAAMAVPLHPQSKPLLSPTQQTQLGEQAEAAGLLVEQTPLLLNWVRGREEQKLRSRQRLLGDITNSWPIVAGGRQHVLAKPHGQDYENYLAMRERAMEQVLLIGANDGFVRLFSMAGKHRYAFLPAALHAGLGQRARSDYGGMDNYRSGMDGRIRVSDAKLTAGWATLAAAGLGAGAKGLFVLRLFDAIRGESARTALWEVGTTQTAAVGHIYDSPVITRLHGRSVVMTGNGYGSENGKGALLIFDLETGYLIQQLDVTGRAGVERSNGLSMPALQLDARGEVIAAFAGDLHGQLWKFDLRGASHTQWAVAHNGAPLFRAGSKQPIAMQPLLHPSLHGDRDLVLFGTGKLLETGDLSDTSEQAVYAVLDVAELPETGLTPERLLQQQLLATQADPDDDQILRTATNHQVNWGRQYGWYLPLVEDGQPRGERVLHNFIIQHGRLIFTSVFLTPGAKRLETASWLMVLNLDHGGMPQTPVLDTTGDRVIDDQDLPVVGLALTIGLPGAVNLLTRSTEDMQPGCDHELYVFQGAEGIAAVAGQPDCQLKRVLWRQLQ